MEIKSMKSRRTFLVKVAGFETRLDHEGEEQPFLSSEVTTSDRRSACELALEEWQETWPELGDKLPVKCVFTVQTIVDHTGKSRDWDPVEMDVTLG